VKFSIHAQLLGVLAASVLCASVGASQQSGAAATDLRTRAIVASFNKSKHVVKEKRGVRKEKYVDVRSEPAVRQNPAEYSGEYEDAGLGFSLKLRVDNDGKVEGTGYEPLNGAAGVARTFRLSGGQINGALFTAKKIYADGSSEPLEGVFINRARFESPTDKGVTAFGLGVTGKSFQVGGQTIDRIFYELKQ
jgi:hypothetical protein